MMMPANMTHEERLEHCLREIESRTPPRTTHDEMMREVYQQTLQHMKEMDAAQEKSLFLLNC